MTMDFLDYGGAHQKNKQSDSGIPMFRCGNNVLDESTAFEASWKVSEIVNPDGSFTVRRKVVSPSGSKIVREDEYPQFNPYHYEESKISSSSADRGHQSTTTGASTSSTATLNYFSNPHTPPVRPKPRHRVTWDPVTTEAERVAAESKYDEDAASTDVSFLTTSESSPIANARKDGFASSAGGSIPIVRAPVQGRKGTGPKWLPANKSNTFILDKMERIDLRPRPVNPASIEVESLGYTTTLQDSDEFAVFSGSRERRDFGEEKFDPYESGPEMSALTEPSNHSYVPASPKRTKSSKVQPRSRASNAFNSRASFDNNSQPSFDNSSIKEAQAYPSLAQAFTVTVVKHEPTAKIGIKVGLKYFTCGPRLIVTHVQPDGPFAGTPVECGDIILSANGRNFLQHASTAEVSEIVRTAKEQVTLTVQKRSNKDDFHSVDDISTASRKYAISKKMMAQKANNPVEQIKNALQLDSFEMKDSLNEKSTRRHYLNADGTMSFVTDRLHDKRDPVISRESVVLSGDLILSARKLSKDQAVGLTITQQQMFDSPRLIVSKIAEGSMFADTPLNVGDELLLVNDEDFRENPNALAASTAISAATGELTICIQKSAASLRQFLHSEKSPPPTAKKGIQAEQLHAGAGLTKELDFDEISYGGSIGGYNSSKSVRLKKSHPREEIGIEFQVAQLKAKSVLVIARISQGRTPGKEKLQIGDVVLSINGVSFQEEPNAEQAMRELRDALSDVLIEYQRLPEGTAELNSTPPRSSSSRGGLLPSVPVAHLHASSTLGASPNRRKFAGAATVDGSADVSTDVEGYSHNPGDDGISALGSVFSGDLGIVGRSLDADGASIKNDSASASSRSSQVSMPVVKRPAVELITIAKHHPDDEVGLTMAVTDGALRVVEVSPTGLLAGKPILPGDVIAAINGKSFGKNPSAWEAAEIVCNADVVVSFEIRRSENENKGGVSRSERKWCNRLACSKRIHPQ